jgi:hypothetical protein
MIPLSNNDFDRAVRLLRFLSRTKGTTLKEKEAARKAGLLVKKLEKQQEETWQKKNSKK